LLAIHGQNEPKPNILFGFAKSKILFGKAQRRNFRHHTAYGFLLFIKASLSMLN